MVDAIQPLPEPEPYIVLPSSPARNRWDSLLGGALMVYLVLAIIVGTAAMVFFVLFLLGVRP